MTATRFVFCLAVCAAFPVRLAFAQAVLPGYLTDPSAMKKALERDAGYQTPERFRYPYVSTYYVKPTTVAGEAVKVSFFVTDFESSKVRFLDDSHRFTAFLEYRPKGGASKVLTLPNIRSGDSEFTLGALPPGEYEMRLWAKDAKGRESHRVIHDFRVVDAKELAAPAGKVYEMTASDLAAYGIRNDGDLERVVYQETNGTAKVVKEKRAGVPGYTVTVPVDPKTGKVVQRAFQQVKVDYDQGYDKEAVEKVSADNIAGLQKLLDEKAAAGFRRVVLLPGTYRMSHTGSLLVPDNMTLDLGKATLKQNGFTGDSSVIVRLSSAFDAHLVGGTLEGDYWMHDYKGSPNNSEWPAGFEIGGDAWYCSVEGVKVADITGYGGQNGIRKDSRGGLSFIYEPLPAFSPGGLDSRTGAVAPDKLRFTTDFKDIGKITGEKGRRRLQISKHLGYQGRVTRSWQMTVAWYDANRKFISAETAWQYREMWIPEKAAFLRVSVEDESAEAAGKSGLVVTAFRIPVNCAVRNCRFEHCRCVGYAASAMKNMLFEGNYFTLSGESAACCAFDAEDGWDQMQDVFFFGNVFRGNPRNNSILTCGGHNFVLEGNDGDVYLWGRTHSPCVRGNAIREATYWCDSRLRSGYGRFDGNTYSKCVHLGENDGKGRTDNWDHVLSGLDCDGSRDKFTIDVCLAGRLVNCTLRNMKAGVANAYGCTFLGCSDEGTGKVPPSGRWFEVTAKDSSFGRFPRTNFWERCHFANTKLGRFLGCSFEAKGCDFTGCKLDGFHSAKIALSNCSFDDTRVQGNYWEYPSDLTFGSCRINTPGDAAFLRLGVYTVGRIVFDGCTVSGARSLVDIHDMRPIARPPSADPATNPDRLPGSVEIRRTKWASEAKTVVAHGKEIPPVSQKKITVNGRGSIWPKGVKVTDDVPGGWVVK